MAVQGPNVGPENRGLEEMNVPVVKHPIALTLAVAAAIGVLASVIFANFAVFLTAVGVGVVALIWLIPKIQTESLGLASENRHKAEDEARKTLVQIAAGVFLAVGAYQVWQNLQETQK